VEAKALAYPRRPDASEQVQMDDYGTILRQGIEGISISTSGSRTGRVYGMVQYTFNKPELPELWYPDLQERIGLPRFSTWPAYSPGATGVPSAAPPAPAETETTPAE
jgi:hypothetical protein